MSVVGFDFPMLNRLSLAAVQQPVNMATNYGVSVVKTSATGPAWRCIGVFHLAPDQNRGKHNCFVEVLDEKGNRDRSPVIHWTTYMGNPTQIAKLDKPDNEPATDIAVEKSYTVTLSVSGGGLPSDSVGNIHTRHNDEGVGNTFGHHSYYIVFQRQGSAVITPPDPVDPPVDGDELAQLRAENAKLRAAITNALAALGSVGAA